jgi:hypothetical protein
VLRPSRDRRALAWQRSRLGVAGLLCASIVGCGSAQRPGESRRIIEAGGPSSRIEERSLADRPGTKVVYTTLSETSTGVVNDVRALAEVAHAAGAIIVVDNNRLQY